MNVVDLNYRSQEVHKSEKKMVQLD